VNSLIMEKQLADSGCFLDRECLFYYVERK
jgi:hypothetical protein